MIAKLKNSLGFVSGMLIVSAITLFLTDAFVFYIMVTECQPDISAILGLAPNSIGIIVVILLLCSCDLVVLRGSLFKLPMGTKAVWILVGAIGVFFLASGFYRAAAEKATTNTVTLLASLIWLLVIQGGRVLLAFLTGSAVTEVIELRQQKLDLDIHELTRKGNKIIGPTYWTFTFKKAFKQDRNFVIVGQMTNTTMPGRTYGVNFRVRNPEELSEYLMVIKDVEGEGFTLHDYENHKEYPSVHLRS